jgi:hypothetical protein
MRWAFVFSDDFSPSKFAARPGVVLSNILNMRISYDSPRTHKVGSNSARAIVDFIGQGCP